MLVALFAGHRAGAAHAVRFAISSGLVVGGSAGLLTALDNGGIGPARVANPVVRWRALQVKG